MTFRALGMDSERSGAETPEPRSLTSVHARRDTPAPMSMIAADVGVPEARIRSDDTICSASNRQTYAVSLVLKAWV